MCRTEEDDSRSIYGMTGIKAPHNALWVCAHTQVEYSHDSLPPRYLGLQLRKNSEGVRSRVTFARTVPNAFKSQQACVEGANRGALLKVIRLPLLDP